MRDLHPARRAIESLIAALLLILASPFIMGAALASLLHFRATPWFRHTRVGVGGEPFRLFKVRTLTPDLDRYAPKSALDGVSTPRSMALLRRLHLDELPQLAHVVLGQMSFVGPRPEMPALHDSLPSEFARLRTSVRPGLTGLWQISHHSVGMIGDRPEYDLLYAAHRNLRLDLWILGRTVLKMVGGGTIGLHQIPRWAFSDDQTSAATPFAATRPDIDNAPVGVVD